MPYNNSYYDDVGIALINSVYSAQDESLDVPDAVGGLVTENFMNFIATSDGVILTTEG